MSGPRSAGIDLLRLAAIRRLILWRGFPDTLQLLVLVVFVALAVIGWGWLTPAGVNSKLYAKANLVNLVIWGLWWPAIIWSMVLFGRAWCIFCPLQLVAKLSEKLGRALGLQQGALPRWLSAGGLVIGFFTLLQLLVPGVQLHRVPAYTSIFLWTMLVGAAAVGLFFKNRAFCRGFCPVALMLNAYGRGGMLAVRPGSTQARRPAAGEIACPSLLNPAALNSNRDCLVCGQCVKTCTSSNMQVLMRAPFAVADEREPLASWPLTLLVMVVTGFVTFELCGVWKTADSVFLWVPAQLSTALHAGMAAGWIQGVWTVAVVPLLLWSVLGAVALLSGGAHSLGEAWRRLALPLAVVVAAGHMAKSLEKFSSWAGFLPYAFADPTGVRTVSDINSKILPQPAAWLSPSLLSALCLVLLTVAVIFAWREAKIADPANHRRRIAPLMLLGGFYFFLVLGWGWL